MTYLWINPVSERMISGAALEGLLRRHQLTRVTCQGDWGEIVLRKYRELLENTTLSYRMDGNNVDLSTENAELAAEQINYNALIDSMNNEFTRMKAVLK